MGGAVCQWCKVCQCVSVTREIISPVVCDLYTPCMMWCQGEKAVCSYKKPVNFNTLTRWNVVDHIQRACHACAFPFYTSVGGRMSTAICMWHVHPLHMHMSFVMHIQIVLKMYSWHPTFFCIIIRNMYTCTHAYTCIYIFSLYYVVV